MEYPIVLCIQERKKKKKSNPEILDMLYSRAQDLQLLLDTPYQSRLHLRDCIIRAVQNEPFYDPSTTMPIPHDPDKLHARLHQVMKQQDNSNFSVGSPSNPHITAAMKSLPAYYVNSDSTTGDKYNPTEFEVLFNHNEQPYFKSRIMRGPTSIHKNKNSQHMPYHRRFGQSDNKPPFGYSKQLKILLQVP